MKNVEFIKSPHTPKCRYCDGEGVKQLVSFVNNKRVDRFIRCEKCNGTGKFDNSSYHLIATKPDGQKIGFMVDDAGK